MAIGFELRVCRLIDIDPPPPKPINWSNSSPYGVPRGGRISISTPCVRGCVCHQTARPCLKFRAIQPWNIDIPCHRSRIPQGRHQRTLFANGLHPYGCACTLQSSSEKKGKKKHRRRSHTINSPTHQPFINFTVDGRSICRGKGRDSFTIAKVEEKRTEVGQDFRSRPISIISNWKERKEGKT